MTESFSLLVNNQPLSALRPVRLQYDYAYNEDLSEDNTVLQGNFEYYTYTLFDNFKDAVLSKKNCLVLTDTLPLKNVFRNNFKKIFLGEISGCAFLKSKKNRILKKFKNQVFAGGRGEDLLVNIFPISETKAFLKTPQNEFLQIDAEYPYTVRLSQETLGSNQLFRRTFQIEYANNEISFKVETPEGFRFLSHGVDNVLRAIGLELNDALINPYKFDTKLVSAPFIDYNFNPKTDEVTYFNDITTFENRSNVVIKQARNKPTSYLVSFSTHSIDENSNVTINLASTKTNFSSSNTYILN